MLVNYILVGYEQTLGTFNLDMVVETWMTILDE